MKYLIFENEGDTRFHAYTFSVTKLDKHCLHFYLHRSNDSVWTEHCRGELCLSIYDDGNGIELLSIKTKMDYAKQSELKLLLKCIELYETEELKMDKESYSIMEEKVIACI